MVEHKGRLDEWQAFLAVLRASEEVERWYFQGEEAPRQHRQVAEKGFAKGDGEIQQRDTELGVPLAGWEGM